MRLATILTTIVLGASAATVAAQPIRPPAQRDWQNDFRGDYYNGRVPVARWVMLAPSIGTATSRAVIGAQQGRFEKLRVQADVGRIYVRSIVVRFNDGSLQRTILGRFLTAGQTVDLDLAGRFRAIRSVVINTERRGYRSAGRYSVSAARSVVTPQYGYAANPYHWFRR